MALPPNQASATTTKESIAPLKPGYSAPPPATPAPQPTAEGVTSNGSSVEEEPLDEIIEKAVGN